MSNTIQMRSYSSHKAALLQQRPSDIIEAAEAVVDTPDALRRRIVQVVYDSGQSRLLDTSVINAGSKGFTLDVVPTSGTQMCLLNISQQTTSPDLLVNVDEFVAHQGSWSRWADETRKLLQRAAASTQRPSMAAAHLRVDRLATLQAAFGFTTQELAQVLGISRQQLYKWLNAAKEVKLNEASRGRLAVIERIAKVWTLRSTMPLCLVSREPIADDGTVFEMLSANVVDEATIVSAFDELVVKLQSKSKTRSQRLRDAGFTRRVSTLPSDE
jgi:transcriptional regulator with XRE-family HTH domain